MKEKAMMDRKVLMDKTLIVENTLLEDSDGEIVGVEKEMERTNMPR